MTWYGKHWKQIKADVRKRDNSTCQRCGIKGTSKTLDCHHKVPFRLFQHTRDANAKSNLITLCKKCHSKADNKYWSEHPLFFDTKRVPFPTCPSRACAKCGVMIENPASGHQIYCKKCCTFTCEFCGKVFFSRKVSDRTPKYCSRKCNIAVRKKEARWSHKCKDCGKVIDCSRYYCRTCWLKDPVGRVQPGRKAGRRPKCHVVNA